MTESEAILTVAEEYRKEGYTVVPRSSQEDNSLLDLPNVDMIAIKGDRILAINVTIRDDQVLVPTIVASGEVGDDYSLSLLKEAERLLMPETRRAAFLMAWTAFEAAAREVLNDDKPELAKKPSALLIVELVGTGRVSPDQIETLRQALAIRNMIVHGVQPTELSPNLIAFLLDTVRKLKLPKMAEQFQNVGGASATIIRRRINENPPLLKQVELTTRLLYFTRPTVAHFETSGTYG